MDGLIQQQDELAQKLYEFWISRVDITTLQYACQQIHHRIVYRDCRMQTTRGRARNIGVTGRLKYRYSSDVYLRLDGRSFLRRERSRDPGRIAQGKVGPGARVQMVIR